MSDTKVSQLIPPPNHREPITRAELDTYLSLADQVDKAFDVYLDTHYSNEAMRAYNEVEYKLSLYAAPRHRKIADYIRALEYLRENE